MHPGNHCNLCELELEDAAALDAHAMWHHSTAYRRVPAACRRCAAEGTVRPASTVAGHFTCSACGERN